MDAAKLVDSVIARFIGTKHERDVKKLQPNVAAINALEPEIKTLSDEELKTSLPRPERTSPGAAQRCRSRRAHLSAT